MQIFNIIVKGIYVNIYKAQKKQKKYLIQMIIMLVIATILDFVFIKIYKSMILVATATLITTMIWFIICEFEKNNEIRFGIKQYIFILLTVVIYITTGCIFNPIVGLLIYVLTVILLSMLLMRETTKYLWGILRNRLKRK